MNLFGLWLLILSALINLPGRPLASWLERTAATTPTHQPAGPLSYTPAPFPLRSSGTAPPPLSAASVLAVDATTALPLYQLRADQPRPIASITKLVTALVIVHNHDLNQLVTIPTLPAYAPGDEVIGLVAGEQFKIEDLLKAALITSGNDAADALAIIDASTPSAFAGRMNVLTGQWGIGGSHFTNPTGLSDQDNYASAQALFQLASLALTNPQLRAIVTTASTTISDQTGRAIALHTTNQLLQDKRFSGIKTGYTVAAGQCLVALVQVQGHAVITIVLGSGDRFGDTAALINWIGQAYSWL